MGSTTRRPMCSSAATVGRCRPRGLRGGPDCGVRLWGAVVVSKDLEGNVSVEQTDHMVEEGAAGLAAVGFVVGLFAPPLLAATAIGAAVGRGRRQGAAQEDRQQDREDGRGDDPHRRRRPHRRLPALGGRAGRARGDARDQKVGRRGGRSPREGAQGRARRRAAEDGAKAASAASAATRKPVWPVELSGSLAKSGRHAIAAAVREVAQVRAAALHAVVRRSPAREGSPPSAARVGRRGRASRRTTPRRCR